MKQAIDILKHKRRRATESSKASLVSPGNPKKMDENTNLRLYFKSNSPKVKLSNLEFLNTETPKFRHKDPKELKRAEELQVLTEIMKECDELYLDNRKTLKNIRLRRRDSFPTFKLSSQDKRRVDSFKSWI